MTDGRTPFYRFITGETAIKRAENEQRGLELRGSAGKEED